MWLRDRVNDNQTLIPLLEMWGAPRSWNTRLVLVTFCGIETWLTARHMFLLLELERYMRYEPDTFPYEEEHIELLLSSVSKMLPDDCQLPEVIVYIAARARQDATTAGIDPTIKGSSLVRALDEWATSRYVEEKTLTEQEGQPAP